MNAEQEAVLNRHPPHCTDFEAAWFLHVLLAEDIYQLPQASYISSVMMELTSCEVLRNMEPGLPGFVSL
jgi:hypothetical protein